MDNKKDKNKYKSRKRPVTLGEVTSIDTARKKTRKKSVKNKTKTNVYYSFLTVVLLICLVQLSFSAILNISKTISYQTKAIQIRKLRDDAEAKNKRLKQEIKDFSSIKSLEAIARNNLKMAGEGEVLILINDKDKNNEKNAKNKKKGIFKHVNR